MTLQRLHVSTRYSEAAIHNGTIHLAGQVPRNPDADMAAQTADVLAQIDDLLAQAGSDRTRLLSVTIYVRDLADYTALNSVWDGWVVTGHAPPRACVQAQLADPRWRLEMVAIAAVKQVQATTAAEHNP